jgi:hypothetical protein
MMNKRWAIVIFAVITAAFSIQSGCKKETTPPVDEPDPVVTCTANITGGCFDEWKDITTGVYPYYEPAGDFLKTLNLLASLPPEIGGPGPVTTEKTTDSYSGAMAAKLISKVFSPQQGTNIFLPGLVASSELNIPAQTIDLGKPYTGRPVSFKGYYKYFPVSGDSALIEVLLTKYNTSLHKRDTIAITKNIIKNTVSSYTLFDYALTYHSTDTPDTAVILLVSSAGINFQNLQGCTGQIGSTMYVDEIYFGM